MKDENLAQSVLASRTSLLTEDVIREWLIRRVADQADVDVSAIDTAAPFDSYGLNSIVTVKIAGDVEKFVKRTLSPALLFEHTSIDELASYLASELENGEPAVVTD
ncbi:MAG: acyl carrier protein [Gammaproteobacteria bacterium]|nr:acyl carrier protein [Gammaproteobacteria bacterium]